MSVERKSVKVGIWDFSLVRCLGWRGRVVSKANSFANVPNVELVDDFDKVFNPSVLRGVSR